MGHLTYQELAAKLSEAQALVKTGGIYQHFKNPESRYEVLGFSILEASDEVAVRYRSLEHKEVEFSRELGNWLDEIDGVPRFKLIS